MSVLRRKQRKLNALWKNAFLSSEISLIFPHNFLKISPIFQYSQVFQKLRKVVQQGNYGYVTFQKLENATWLKLKKMRKTLVNNMEELTKIRQKVRFLTKLRYALSIVKPVTCRPAAAAPPLMGLMIFYRFLLYNTSGLNWGSNLLRFLFTICFQYLHVTAR